ncbi:mitochondrial ATPase inhibitor, IATP-domain-containing protein [Apodospora peruviana]|uniref:ATPase inhibitor, mitochondrial n=1 Tax=Apodospora peruviana TaxID=516989 RepID=A0AAE0IR50_9PEZI|nr:mitochondrial ATPase inhibitor, IATP-domain-containing protein [Apodospora peruviana]
MLRTTIVKAARPARLVSYSRATFATTARAMGAGDTGAPPKTGGQGDAFQRREKAQEDYAIKQREKEKLLELKKKLHEQQAHLQQLSDHIDDITKNQGGEHN